MQDQPPSRDRDPATTGEEDTAAGRPARGQPGRHRPIDLVGVLTIGFLLLLLAGGWLLYPQFAAYMRVQDCLASFRTPSACR
ncbi:protein of unknown function [Rhodovastum atsumiense]|uniref:hypothetical protein n=1 Tax=Rhodovastum atsumiense TaxID=504468 RepID=UPI00139F2C42|nr:hypothetical protein [Rhodovastum atsumiense]CAH2602914.1 protein of unknown function [Rhodovastum atsumiense]